MLSELAIDIPSDSRPFYLRIAEGIRTAIREGKARPGERIPSTRRLAEAIGTNRHTVMAALGELAAEGWIEGREKRAFAVGKSLPNGPIVPSARETSLSDASHDWRVARGSIPRVALPIRKFKYNFQSGLAELRQFPLNEFRLHINEALRRSGEKILNYGDPAGLPSLTHEIATYLRRMRSISGRSIIVTPGAQGAIFLAAQLLIKPGDRVAVECPGYPPAWEAFRMAGAKLVPIQVGREGLDLASLKRAAERKKLRLIYTTPLHQYPTTVTLPVGRRLELYEIARRFGIPILEDDYDHEFHYSCQPLAPLSSQDPDGLVVYASTFSKIMFPALRIGFLCVPSGLADSATQLRRVISTHNDTLMQDALARWIRAGDFERHLRKMRRLYEKRRDVVIESLGNERSSELDIDWHVPDGGMALWLDTRADAEKVAKYAASNDVQVMPENLFQLKREPRTCLRLGFANQNETELRAGLKLLFSAIKKAKTT